MNKLIKGNSEELVGRVFNHLAGNKNNTDMLFLITSYRFFSTLFQEKPLDNIFYRKNTNSGNFTSLKYGYI